MPRIPKLRIGSRGRALVEFRRHRFYFGQHGTPKANAAYDNWVRRFLAGEFDGPRPQVAFKTSRMSIARLAVFYLGYLQRCVEEKTCSPAEFCNTKGSVELVVGRFRRLDASAFGAPELVDVQSDMIRKGWRHRVVNQRINRVRKWFRWAVMAMPESDVNGEQVADLAVVDGLRKGRANLQGLLAEPSRDVGPVDWTDVEKVLPFVSRDVAAIVRVQYATGSRPGEVVCMRQVDIDTSRETWVFTPQNHKTQWRGKHLVKAIPDCLQDLLADFFGPVADQFLFRPSRPDKSNTGGSVGDRYTTCSYRRAVTRGIVRARRAGFDVPSWTPNQLRHSIATEISRRLG
jgi:integrase